MDQSDEKARKERDETDARLRAERVKTDSELSKTRTTVERDADRVVDLARERAETLLRATRERADEELKNAGAGVTVQREIAIERAEEDGVVAEERSVAAEQLRAEREERQRALAALLRLERDATDDGLLVERAHADEVVATRDDFLAMVSHDLRGILGGIAFSAALLAKHGVNEGKAGAETVRHAERIQRFTARMNRLVGDLLDVVSLEAGELHVTPKRFDVTELVAEAQEVFAPLFSGKGITLTSKIAHGPLVASFDHERILQVLANLLSNALKFTPAGGKVGVAVARAGNEILFSVTDDGVGIPEDQLVAIFERFRQVLMKDRRGLGLGLYIAKCIVEAHAGRIWAERPKTGGTAFHFTLPATP